MIQKPLLIGAISLLTCAAHAESLTLYSLAADDAFIQFGRAGGIGDETLWNSELQDEAGNRIGSNAGRCVRLDAAGAHLCSIVVEHEGHGTMILSGVQRPEPQPSDVVITGGTGAYRGATGSVISTPVENRARFRYDIEYALPGP